MTAVMTATFLLAGTPILGATIGLLMWRKPQSLKIWLLLVAVISLGTIAWTSGGLRLQPGQLFLLGLLPLMAFVTLLGQPLHSSHAATWLLTLLLLGLGLGSLTSEAPLSLIFFLLLLVLVGLMLSHYRPQTGFNAWWGVGTLGLGVLGLLVALTEGSPISSVAFAVACATVLPLVPFHKGYVVALTELPGNLPAFLAVVLPVIGFHGLMAVLPEFTTGLGEAVRILALVGMVYGSLKALTQSRAASVVAYGGVAFLSLLWWYPVVTRNAAPQTVVYLSAVSLAGSGLLLAWYALRARYGEVGLRALSGLAQPMPRFAIALSLLALAALGLPPFGVFSGFLGMLLAPSFTWSGGVTIIVIAWLSASWYFFDLVQGLLFGRQDIRRRHDDLHDAELGSLVIVLALLVALGIMPSHLFDLTPADLHRTAGLEWTEWTK